ncbi:MAG TPA: HEAT repeat domain-containing protein [Bacteroidota bacterium]
MTEPHVVEDLLALVNGNLDAASSRLVKDHIASCGECRREFDALTTLWDELGRSPEELPGASLNKGFQEMLKAYEQGLRHSGNTQESTRRGNFLDRFRFGRPAFQVGLALCTLVIGIVCGYSLNGSSRNTQELAQLREEVHGLSNLLTVSLLHQESASERLKGVSWSSKVEGRDPAISAALVYTMKHDRNVNVRLAALDALSRDLNSPAVRREIIHALPDQTSPLMQVALVELLVQINDRESRDVLQQALTKPDLHPDVRKRITQGIQQIL